ncbi:MAG: ABC transporter ATP-binding protein [Leptospiraceae bacterium]|nr:ABC transporter ATP-binding protein [Leptospiraceae bacterium]MCP5495389.1 ABC transporter ATP-binding protein [Leptospiraceae bacterium]
MLKLVNVNKIYSTLEHTIHVLKNINLSVEEGEFIAIMGPSGSGKSTLLGISAGLDRIDSGLIYIDGQEISLISEDELCSIRAQKIGFIFQNFQLIKTLNALENVCLPLVISSDFKESEIRSKAKLMLEKVSLENRFTHFPSQLSGGEMQRVAIARAFMNNPRILFADEPTGNLDSKNGDTVMKMLSDLNKSTNSILIIVTHDPKIARYADKIYTMRDGELSQGR